MLQKILLWFKYFSSILTTLLVYQVIRYNGKIVCLSIYFYRNNEFERIIWNKYGIKQKYMFENKYEIEDIAFYHEENTSKELAIVIWCTNANYSP